MKLSSLFACVLAALALTSSAKAVETTSCGDSGYSYAGLGGLSASDGVRANVRLSSAPLVASGHVAAWVGFGGHGAGANGSDAWLQVGVITKAGEAPQLYYEVARPGREPAMTMLGPAKIGRAYALRVRELTPGFWRAYVDARAVSPRFFLRGSHNRWEATAVAESWDGAQPTCNRFGVDFGALRVLRGTTWQPLRSRVTLQSPGYRVDARTDGFRATG